MKRLMNIMMINHKMRDIHHHRNIRWGLQWWTKCNHLVHLTEWISQDWSKLLSTRWVHLKWLVRSPSMEDALILLVPYLTSYTEPEDWPCLSLGNSARLMDAQILRTRNVTAHLKWYVANSSGKDVASWYASVIASLSCKSPKVIIIQKLTSNMSITASHSCNKAIVRELLNQLK